MIQTLFGYFILFGYWVVLFGVALENAGLPIPGETILLAAGFFAAQGHFSLQFVIVIATTGAVLGDNAGYWIGRNLGRRALVQYGRYVLLSSARLERLDSFFQRYGSKTIFIARFVTGLRVFAALFAGAAQMPWRMFFIYNVAGAIVWSITIALIGFFFGEYWDLILRILRGSGVLGLVVIIVALLFRWLYLKRRRRLVSE
jgi:membrane protein DedA with SNARE-associated domain